MSCYRSYAHDSLEFAKNRILCCFVIKNIKKAIKFKLLEKKTIIRRLFE